MMKMDTDRTVKLMSLLTVAMVVSMFPVFIEELGIESFVPRDPTFSCNWCLGKKTRISGRRVCIDVIYASLDRNYPELLSLVNSFPTN